MIATAICMVNKRSQYPSSTLYSMHDLRYRIFYQRLDWEVPINATQEKDEYDDLEPAYIIAKSPSDQVVGCMRLLPTMGSYMLKDTFPELLGDSPAPQCNSIIEISRFAVDKDYNFLNSHGINYVSLMLFKNLYLYSTSHGYTSAVAVTTPAIEKYLKKIGIKVKRIGAQKAMLVGNSKAIAIQFNLDLNFYLTIRSALNQ
ncbi:acyl-homoserine-lactone synthase [Zooshikella sp. RANM57]|uniref:acyl-homoserine-lactone synthase n=1 Tax=Zooshikella sp. RANM57 TaxID=3425863 RepID=UPI003D6E47E5